MKRPAITYLLFSINMDPIDIITRDLRGKHFGTVCDFMHKNGWYFAAAVATGFVICKLLKTVMDAADNYPRTQAPYHRYHGQT